MRNIANNLNSIFEFDCLLCAPPLLFEPIEGCGLKQAFELALEGNRTNKGGT